MSFLSGIINEFTHQGQGGGSGQHNPNQPYQSSSYSGQPGPAPRVPPPWRAVWDERDGRWLFVNEANGERTFEFPQQQQGAYNQGYGQSGGQGYAQPYGGGGYNQGYQRGDEQGFAQGQRYAEQQQQQQRQHHGGGHGLAYGALGAAAGLAGGAVLMHEGEKVHEDWDEDKYAVENRVDRFGRDVEDAPEEAAGWAGRRVGEVEDIPQNVEGGFERAKWGVEDRFDRVEDRVEDVPQDVAWDVGQGVGDVERFDGRVEDAFDDGRDQGRYDDGGY